MTDTHEEYEDTYRAFPHPAMGTATAWPGMSLRDYFAAVALSGRLADQTVDMTTFERAADAYRMADAMLAQRDKS